MEKDRQPHKGHESPHEGQGSSHDQLNDLCHQIRNVAQVAKGMVNENRRLRKHQDDHDSELLERIEGIERELNRVRSKCDLSD